MIKILSVFVFLSLKLFAQESLDKKVKFDEFLSKALKNSSYLKALHLDITKSSLQSEISTRYKNPTLELEYTHLNTNVGVDKNGYRVALLQSLTLWDVANDKERASLSRQKRSQAQYLVSYSKLVQNISSLYAQYAQEKELYILKEEELLIAKRIYDISKEHYKLGTISKGEMLQVKVDFEMLDIILNAKEISYKEKYFKLLELAGYFYEIELNHKHKFDLKKKIDLNPDLIFLDKTKKYVLDTAKVNAHRVEAIDLIVEFESEPQDNIYKIGIAVPLAIFDTKYEEREIAKIEAKKLNYSIKNYSSKISFKILQLKQERDLLTSVKNKNEETLRTQKKLLLMFEEAYKIANANLLELQNVKNNLIQTKKNLIHNKFALDINAIHINYISGAYNE